MDERSTTPPDPIHTALPSHQELHSLSQAPCLSLSLPLHFNESCLEPGRILKKEPLEEKQVAARFCSTASGKKNKKPSVRPPQLAQNIVSSSGKMTAKHRKGKGNHNHKHGEDNFFKNDATETEVRGGSGNYAPHLVLLAVVLIGGAAGAWFCLQQQQTLAQLTDSFTGMQVKMVKLQSSHEEVRQSSSKVREIKSFFETPTPNSPSPPPQPPTLVPRDTSI